MAIDINQPVKQGHDLILNYEDGSQRLGSDSGFAREAEAGKLLSLPPNDNPNGDVNPPDAYGTQLDLEGPQQRGANGRFQKK